MMNGKTFHSLLPWASQKQYNPPIIFLLKTQTLHYPPKWFLLFSFSTQTLYSLLLYYMHATCHIMYYVNNIWWRVTDMNLTTESSAPLHSYLHLTSNTLLTTLLSQTLSLCSFLDVRHQISHPLQNFKGNYHFQRSFSGVLVIKTSNPNLPFQFINTEVYTFFRTIKGGKFSTITSIYAGRTSVQILAWTRELSQVQNIQTSSSPHPASNSVKNHSFISDRKVASADSLTTHIHLEPSLKINGAIPPLNLCPWHILGQPNFTFTSYLCTYLSRGHILSSLIKESLYTLLTVTCTLDICQGTNLKINGAIPPLNLSVSMAHIGTTSYILPMEIYKTLWTVSITNLIT